MKLMSCACVWAVLCLSATTTSAQSALSVVSIEPSGEVTSGPLANEIRIVFSEPMVALGQIPDPVRAPFVQITPAVSGSFRWSGTTILIFTPERPLPFATRYQVTVDTTATAVSGRRLEKPVTSAFSTPAVRLNEVAWYRRGGTVDGRIVLVLTFNQPVRSADVAAALSARFEPHDWRAPELGQEQAAAMRAVDPAAVDRFNAKVKQTQATAASRAPVTLQPTTSWNQEVFKPAPERLAFEVMTDVDPEGWLHLAIAGTVRSPAGPATPDTVQTYTVETEPAFFVDRFYCVVECNPDRRNGLRFRTKVIVEDFAKAATVVDAANGNPVARPAAPPQDRQREYYYEEEENSLTLEDAGYPSQPPNRKYTVTIPASLRSADGQVLGYTWVGSVDNWHHTAFTSFGDGQGVWEKSGGSMLPFYGRNLQDITQWVLPIQSSDLMSAVLRSRNNNFVREPPPGGTTRRLGGTADQIQSHGLDVSKALSGGATGVLWAAVRDGNPIARAERHEIDGRPVTRASIVQVTNLGMTVKDSPQNTLVFVTRLDTGAPVPGANVSIVRTDNTTQWRGVTNADGIALAPNTPLRDPDRTWEFSFIVVAEKDGDVAYVGSDWNEGISGWEFGVGYDLLEAAPLLRGSVFTDRGVYRLGEEVHFKAILRHNTPDGVRMLAADTPVAITVRDAQNKIVDERSVRVSNWSSAEWTWQLPDSGALGNYSLRAILESDRPKPDPRKPARTQYDDDYQTARKGVSSAFLVAAYRRPDFRVDVTLTGATGTPIAGDKLRGVVAGRYLFGAGMSARPVTWSYTASHAFQAPSEITERYGDDRWVFVGWSWDDNRYGNRPRTIGGAAASLTADGQLTLDLDTEGDGLPQRYQLEGDVEDVSRQHIANRNTLLVHPAPFYVGVKRPPYFSDQKAGLDTEIVAVGLDGKPVGGIPVAVTLTQLQWKSVRRAEGDGFYTWDTEQVEVPSGNWTITTAEQPVPLKAAISTGGYFRLDATGTGADGRYAKTRTTFYVTGDGYTAWQRFDHNRIELIPEKQTWKPGDTARIMIQSPWESATALVTTEREGIRSQKQFALTSTMQTISVPITEQDIPNVFVSVVLVTGRTSNAPSATSQVPDDTSAEDPGKPSFRMGYVELKVEDRAKRLTVAVTANKEEYRPASAANLRLDVKDHLGRGTASEVTLWAVDYGVLSLTGYRTPDVLESVHVRKALQVMNADNRQRIISRRVLTPKGSTDGGGGGAEPGAGTLRKDFRVLAFWLGSVTTNADGRASLNVKLPESLTTYRIMAVAADRASRFGSADTEVRTNKPLTLKPTFPRFMTVGDRAYFGAAVGSQLKSGGTAIVTMKSLDPGVLELVGAAQQQVRLGPAGTLDVRFEAVGKSIGRARVQMTARLGSETDAFEDVIPVAVQLSPETVATYGETSNVAASETLRLPSGAVPGFGGLNLELASTALVGVGEGARYLVEYPYGCAEQRASKARALMLAADLGETFSLSEMTPAQMRAAAQQTLGEIERLQCDTGAFSFWPGNCSTTSPYLTAYLLQTLKTGVDLKYQVDPGVRDRGYRYLESALQEAEPTNAGWLPSYLAWQAFAVKVLAEGGHAQDSHVTRLYGHRERMPMFAIAFLHDAVTARKETGARVEELRRRMQNAILQEAGSAHVDDFNDPELAWFWHTNARTTAIVLNSFVKANVAAAPIRPLVRWLMLARKNGRWGNTQENAYAMEALVNYYRAYEPTSPQFTAVVKLGEQELLRAQFEGRSTEAQEQRLPMAKVMAAGPAGSEQPLTFSREGTGTLFYTARLRYAVDQFFSQGLDAGFKVERRYELVEGVAGNATPTSFSAGDLVRVTLTFQLPKERRFVAVTDPLPAGFEAVESWFETTKSSLTQQNYHYAERAPRGWRRYWGAGYFDHIERHDDRVQLFATSLSEGAHTFSYVVRATTSGTFRTAPTRVEEMYTPEIFGRSASTQVEVRR